MGKILHQSETFHQSDLDRISDPEVARILRGIQVVQREVLAQIAEIRKEQDNAAKAMQQTIAAAASDMERCMRAFPSEDVDGHKRFHEMMIEQLEEKRRLRRAIQEKTIAGLVWAALIGLSLAMWHYLKELLK